ncbi:MAG: 4Fe-4S binding protein [Anaerolineales bacterium]|nr:4Fe-4S binding protein [Anaerolineales bacterium]
MKIQGRPNQVARSLVQWGFLFLFFFPLVPLFYRKFTFQSVPDFASWLLLWDPLLALGNLLNRNISALIIGAPLFLLVLSFILGRSFCGWVCPLGTILDLVWPLAVWRKKKKVKKAKDDQQRNSRLRYFLLIAALGGSLFSIKLLGLVDPLVIFSRASNAEIVNLLSSQQAVERGGLTYFSLFFTAIVLLEFWQPRFWCRHLCPQGALLSLVSRFSLLNRRVSTSCSSCGACKRDCPMDAIPLDAHNTDYSDCIFCMECQTTCPEDGISFGFGGLALAEWQSHPKQLPSGKIDRRDGEYVAAPTAAPVKQISRRDFLQGLGALAAGAVVFPLTLLEKRPTPLRPPGALPEDEFLNVCIACQECVRVCPTHGLQADFLGSGLSGIGMPVLAPRLGGCSLGVSCNHLCQQVCPVDAILPVSQEGFKIGTAKVDRSLCLAWDQGVKCLVCVEACQYHAAIPFQGRVTVNADKCVGCGFCESGCPVPGSAIRVYPNDSSTI